MQRRNLFTVFTTLVALLVASQLLLPGTSLAREKESGDDRGRSSATTQRSGKSDDRGGKSDDRGRGGNHTEASDDRGRGGNHTEASDDRDRGGNHAEPGDDRGGVVNATPVVPAQPCLIIEPGDDTPQPCPVVPGVTPTAAPTSAANDDHGRHRGR